MEKTVQAADFLRDTHQLHDEQNCMMKFFS